MSTAPQQALAARHLSVTLDHCPVLQQVNLQISAGHWTCIVGPNGAGKSTLLRALAGLMPCEGEVLLQGRRLTEWPARERAKALAWLGQNELGTDELTVYDLAMLGRLPHQKWLAPPNAQDRLVVERVLRQTQLWDWHDRPLGQLSGGERQRALLARVLAVEAQIVLMDEPLASLDPPHQADWLAEVRSLVTQGITVVSVLHELNVALQADALVVLGQGRVLHTGSTHDPATHAALQAVFDHRIQLHEMTVAGESHWVALPHA